MDTEGPSEVCKVRLGYAFLYLYAAIAPATGRLICLLLPRMTKTCFALFVEYFKQQTRNLHGTHPVVLIADRAGAHEKQLCRQKGIVLEHLPRACPELNPVERFFEELRKELSNRVFNTLTPLENYLCKILKKYFDHPRSLVQLCYYPYMRTT